MGKDLRFDALIVVTADDFNRLLPVYPKLISRFSYGKICFISPHEVDSLIQNARELQDKARWIDENKVIKFDDVHRCMSKRLAEALNGRELPRGMTGWYYQQFLKMQYSEICEDEYYMVWDGDTVPCRDINMFNKDTGKPYLDMKHEYHQDYFDTMSIILPGLKKVIERSFIAEHMLIRTDIMQNLIKDIEKNNSIPGTKFWEKIINAIPPEKFSASAFSEFETYGTYVAIKYPDVYKLRDWHSFRLGAQFFGINTITDSDIKWLSKDFDAISFEKNQQMIGDGNSFFNDPYYQEKLSAKQMLQAIQMEFNGGYKEVWADDPVTMKNANRTAGRFVNGKGIDNRTLFVIVADSNLQLLELSITGIKESLSLSNYKIIVVSSPDKDIDDYLSNMPEVIHISNDEQFGFYKSINKAVEATKKTEYKDWDVYAIKSGTRVIFDSIHFLKQALYSQDTVGAVGSVSNLAGNKQKLDVSFTTPEEYIAFGEKNNVLMDKPFIERVNLSGNSIMIKREVLDKAGGFAEDYESDGPIADADLSFRIMKLGYKLILVRNSFVYRQNWDECEDVINNNDLQKLNSKVGFDVLKVLNSDLNAISSIPFTETERFNMIEVECGIGSTMKAVKSLYPNAQVVGIEKNVNIADLASKTETVFNSFAELKKNIEGPAFNLIMISEKCLDSLDDSEKGILGSMCYEDFKVVAK